MAVLRIEIDVDSDVHPELHAALSTIADPSRRAERLRQLAAAGLIWETVRLHGYPKAFDLPAAAPVARPGAAPAPDWAAERAAAGAAAPLPPRAAPAVGADTPVPAAAPVAARPVAAPPAVSSPVSSPAAAPAPGPARRGRTLPRPDFIDLAIDAAPSPAPWDGVERRGSPPESVPLLVDVIDAPAAARARGKRTARTRASDVPTLGEDSILEVSLPDLAPARAREAVARPARPVDAPVDPPVTGFDPLEAVPAVAPLAQRPETKSRLMRMKERGLFRNG